MATNQFIARFNPRSITKKGRYMVQNLVPDSAARKAAGAAAIVAGVPGAREVALSNLGSGSEANAPMMPDIYGNQDIDPNSPGPAQITDPNAPVNIAPQRESTPEMGMERQEAIANQGRGARYDENSIMGLISSLVGNPKANEAFDSTKPVGGANVPYQEAKGLQRFFGNQANQLNLGAQAAQGAEWKADAKEQKAEDRALNRMREADKPTQSRFEATQASNLASENTRNELTKEQMKDLRDDRIARLNNEVADRAARVAEWENSRLFSAGEGAKGRTFQAGQAEADRTFRSNEGAADRGFRKGESQADRDARLSEGEANRSLTAAHYNLVREDNAADRGLRANEGAANRALTAAQQNLVREDNEANRTLRANEGAAGRAIDEARLGLQRDGQAGDQAYRAGEAQYRRRANVERLGENVYQNEKGEIFEHTPGMPGFGKNKGTPGGFRRLTMPGAMAPKGGGGGQVDRGTGATLGGGVLPPGGGVRMGGALPPPPMTQAAPAVVTQPRSATLADTLVNLPGMGAALDMGYYMTPERSARLEESKKLQQAESLKRTRAMQEQAYGDLGPSMY